MRKTLAEAHLAAGDAPRAVAALAGKATGVPTLALILGKAQRLSGDATAARATLEPFIAKLPTTEEAANAIGDPRPAAGIALEWGHLLAATNNSAEAIRFFETSTRLYPNSAEAFQALGEAQKAAGNQAAAEGALAQSKELADAQAQLRAEWQAEHEAAREARRPGWQAEFHRQIYAMRERLHEDWNAERAIAEGRPDPRDPSAEKITLVGPPP